MRLITEIPNPHFKITVFEWNQKYLIKLEQEGLEQTFKVSVFDVANDEALKSLIDDDFINSAKTRFNAMRKSLDEALSKNQNSNLA